MDGAWASDTAQVVSVSACISAGTEDIGDAVAVITHLIIITTVDITDITAAIMAHITI
jgi:hypothetical protein